MNKPKLSPDFTVDDIRKLRDYNSARHLSMTIEEIRKEQSPKVEAFKLLMSERKARA